MVKRGGPPPPTPTCCSRWSGSSSERLTAMGNTGANSSAQYMREPEEAPMIVVWLEATVEAVTMLEISACRGSGGHRQVSLTS